MCSDALIWILQITVGGKHIGFVVHVYRRRRRSQSEKSAGSTNPQEVEDRYFPLTLADVVFYRYIS